MLGIIIKKGLSSLHRITNKVIKCLSCLGCASKDNAMQSKRLCRQDIVQLVIHKYGTLGGSASRVEYVTVKTKVRLPLTRGARGEHSVKY